MARAGVTVVSDFDAAVRLISGGTNIVIYNDIGLPSIFVRRDAGNISDVIDGGPDTVHYAFIVDGLQVPAFYMGKYLATVYKGRALSLPFQDPAAKYAESTSVNFDNAKKWCEANGDGFHLPTIAEYAWIALLSRKNGTMPRGNNSYGADVSCQYEKCIPSTYSGVHPNRTLTGSGPATWNDNWKPDGICDLNGNVYEWQGGYRTVNGEIQIFADNDAANHYSQSQSSTYWKAILPDGTLVEPGTDGTLKWDYTRDPNDSSTGIPFCLNTKLTNQQASSTPSGSMKLSDLKAASGVIVPDRLKALALMPDDSGVSYGGDYAYMKNLGECFAGRGGYWNGTDQAGVFLSHGYLPRTYFDEYIGFRPAFISGL